MAERRHISVLKEFRLVMVILLTVSLILSVVAYTVIDRLLSKSATAYAQNTAQKFCSEVQFLFERVDALTTQLLFDANIERLLGAPYSQETPAYLKNIQMQFSSYSIMNKDVTDIALVSPEMSWSNFFDRATLTGLSRSLDGCYETACFGLQGSPLIGRTADGDVRLVFGRNVYGMHDAERYGRLLGSIVLSLDLSKSSVTLPTAEQLTTVFILVDQNGRSFPFNGTREECDTVLAQCAPMTAENVQETVETADYLVYLSPIQESGLYVISATDRHASSRSVAAATGILFAISAGTLLLFSLLMHMLMRSMVRPLSALSAHIKRIRLTAPGTPKEPVSLPGCLEIQTLCGSFNEMMAAQDRLAAQLQATTVNLYEAKLGRQQAELDNLRSQINPHFLYNALESIRDLASERDVPELAQAAGALGKLFRYNTKGGAVVPLRQELEITRAYLTVQKVRFGERLSVIESVRDNALDVPVMKLLLQPLVENAVYHGLEPKTTPGTLFIGARIEGSDLFISIYDDGVGVRPERLAELQAMLADPMEDDPAQTHVGLRNVCRRVRLHYGGQYGVTIESALGQGTRLVLKIPAQTEEEAPC